ncbi:hypothetical protein AYI70_g1638 [Smittium culicis]|uniref:Uncharacterized protein n=1 Tax=Smittium culicis TaxID=133412 RepID=A0A1R1YBR2_9FUNG|nr:hypothetical protein AYI70_g7420 [Smittium culicis]OMJ24367.1 hypothetical protein AYI70_g1638 [Smittium culicis]
MINTDKNMIVETEIESTNRDSNYKNESEKGKTLKTHSGFSNITALRGRKNSKESLDYVDSNDKLENSLISECNQIKLKSDFLYKNPFTDSPNVSEKKTISQFK